MKKKNGLIHKYKSSNIWDITSKCGIPAWKNGNRYWKNTTCKECLKYKKLGK